MRRAGPTFPGKCRRIHGQCHGHTDNKRAQLRKPVGRGVDQREADTTFPWLRGAGGALPNRDGCGVAVGMVHRCRSSCGARRQ